MAGVKDGARHSWATGVANNTILSLLNMTVTRAVGLAVSVLVARRLGAESLGVFQQASVLATAFAIVATWGMPTSIIPYLACSGSEDERQSLIRASLLAAGGFAVIIAVPLAILSPHWAQWLLHRPLPGVLRLTALGIVLLSGAALAAAWLQGLNRFQVLAETIVAGAIPTGMVIVVLTYAWGVHGAVLSISMVAMLFMLLAFARCRDIRPSFSWPWPQAREDIQRLLATGTAALAAGLPAVVAPLVFTWMLGARGLANAGYFSLSQTVSQILLFLPNALTMALLPPLSRLAGDDPDAGATAFNTSLQVCGSIVLISTALLVGLLPWIVPLLYGREFGAGVLMVAWYAVAAPVMAVNMVIVQFLLARKMFWKAAAFNASWLAASIPCTALIIIRADPSWAGAGLALGHCAALLAFMMANRRSQPQIMRSLGKLLLSWMVIPIGFLLTANAGIGLKSTLLWLMPCALVFVWMWRSVLSQAVLLVGPSMRR